MDTQTPNQLIRAVDEADSPERLIAAVKALADAQLESGVETLIRALGFNNPGAAVMAMKGLIRMGPPVVPHLLAQIDDYNYGARSYSIRALAAISDPRALDILQKAAATDFAPSVRRAASKGLGLITWSSLLPEQIADRQQQTWETLQQVIQDADWSIRYAALCGMTGLAIAAHAPQLRTAICQALAETTAQDNELAVQARAQFAKEMIESAQE
ncbi:MAG: HEAT repeat domain-containing protein [Thainema sp.]